MTRAWLCLAFCLACAEVVVAAPARVEGVRIWSGPSHTRVVFDVSRPVKHELFTLEDPARVVVDVPQTRLDAALPATGQEERIRRIRSGIRDGTDLRVVFDLARDVEPKSFLLKPQGRYGHRLVVDLNRPEGERQPVRTARSGPPGADDELVVAIDAGHGGEDPGAIGPSGTQEKVVTLQIARRLARLVENAPGMRPVMIREGDYYLALRERIRKARREHADVFLSIHADAFRNHRARGASVYVLSEDGASDEAARWLAEQENASDLIGGVSLEDKDEVLASVLLDLSQTATIDASLDLGDRVLDELMDVGHVHKREVLQAPFAVLKSPDLPSVLVETAFISNPREERKLQQPAHQRQLAAAMLSGVRRFFTARLPAGSRLATAGQHHVIERGDTLSGIARAYEVSLGQLRAINDIQGDRIRVGEVLTIPASSGG